MPVWLCRQWGHFDEAGIEHIKMILPSLAYAFELDPN